MRRPFSSVIMALALSTTVLLPSFMFMVLHTSSMAAGVFLLSFLYILLFAVVGAYRTPIPRLRALIVRVAAVLVVIVLHGAANLLIHGQFDVVRFVQSYLFLIFVFSAALALVLLVRNRSDYQADFAVRSGFYVLLISGVLGTLQISPFTSEFNKPVVFFTEPSHFALSFLPFLLYMTVNAGRSGKVILVLAGYALALLIENLTLVVGVTVIAALTLSLRRSVTFALLMVTLTVFASVNMDYFAARVNLSDESQNLSALVYVSGWERALMDFENTLGVGVGFQQFGIIGDRGSLMDTIWALSGEDLNLQDGGAVAPKFIGEFGVMGLMMVLAYLVYFVKSAKRLRNVSMGNSISGPADIFFLSCFAMYSMDLFVRGAGYFTPSSFLFFAAGVWVATGTTGERAFMLRRRSVKRSAADSMIQAGEVRR